MPSYANADEAWLHFFSQIEATPATQTDFNVRVGQAKLLAFGESHATGLENHPVAADIVAEVFLPLLRTN